MTAQRVSRSNDHCGGVTGFTFRRETLTTIGFQWKLLCFVNNLADIYVIQTRNAVFSIDALGRIDFKRKI